MLRRFVPVLVAAVVLPACSGDDSGSTTSVASTSAVTTSAAATSAATTSVATSEAPTSAATTAAPTTTEPAATTTTEAPTTTTTEAPTTTQALTTVASADVADGPADDSFYEPPQDLIDGPAGSVVWRRTIEGPPGAQSWLILYRSRSVSDEPIVVSATIYIPESATEDTPIVSWAHGTTGSGDLCAPSKFDRFVPGSDAVVGRGWIEVSTDYEGLGTPGLHPYLVGESEARSVLDAARAAQFLSGSGGQVLLWGHSQGGQSALWAAQEAVSYAPELSIAGTVAVAPASRIAALGGAGGIKALGGFYVPFIAGLATAYPELDMEDAFTDETISNLHTLETACLPAYFEVFGSQTEPPSTVNLLELPAWKARLEANDPSGFGADTAPILVLQGDQDTTVSPSQNEDLLADTCAVGTATMEYRLLPGKDHITAFTDTIGDALDWMQDRLDGTDPVNSCP
jgi:pimeloyl-ACP methyl ester carboxylesterase